jgi:hypothetical protein
MPRSRITTGFHLAGIVLATPLIVVAVVLASLNGNAPSGPLKEQLPEGALGLPFGDDEPDVVRCLADAAVQRATGFTRPKT